MSQDESKLMRKCLKCDHTVLDGAVKFIVGSEKKVFSIERSKLEKYLYSLEQYNGEEYPVNVSVDLFQVFVDMIEDKVIVITSILGAFELMKFAKSISCPKLLEACNQYLITNCEGEHTLSIHEYAKANGLYQLANNCFEYIISKLKVEESKSAESEEKNIKSSTQTVKFLVGPEKVGFTIEKDKLLKFLQSMDIFNEGECILDVPVESFQIFLNMINEEPFTISSTTMAFELLKLAEKLTCFRLNNVSLDHLGRNYKCDRALAIYQYAKNNNLTALAEYRLEYIEENFATLIETEDFFELNVETIAELYSSNDLNATELDLVKALISYAKRHGKVDMKVAVDKILFGEMDIEQLLTLEGIDCLLTDKQLLQVVTANYGSKNYNKTRAEYQIHIDVYNMTHYKMTTSKKIQCTFTFSQNVYLENIRLNKLMIGRNHISKIIFNTSDIEKEITTTSNLIEIKNYIKKDDEVRVILLFREHDGISFVKGIIATLTKGVIINSELIGFSYLALFDIMNIRGIDWNKTLEITMKTQEFTE